MMPRSVSVASYTLMQSNIMYSYFCLSDEEDWNDIIITCNSLAAKWQQISGFIGLSIKTIQTIRQSYPNDSIACLNEALMQWILQEYNAKKHGLPSWKTLLKAISRVDEPLFERLAKEHPALGRYVVRSHNRLCGLQLLFGKMCLSCYMYGMIHRMFVVCL